jgi:hypothetical protein
LSLATSKRHWTNAGRIVYPRPPHKFSIKDASRIIRKLEPSVEQLPFLLLCQIELSALVLRTFDLLLTYLNIFRLNPMAILEQWIEQLQSLLLVVGRISPDLEKNMRSILKSTFG